MAVADWQRTSGPASLRATGYAQRNSLNLFSNFTYFLDHPDEGDQFEQAERRVTAGGRFTYRRLGRVFGRHAESSAGVQVRRDWLAPGRPLSHGQRARGCPRHARTASVRRWPGSSRRPRSSGARDVRTTLGLRADVYQYAVTSDTAAQLRTRHVRPRQPEARRGVRTLGRHRVVRQRRHRLPQQRCPRRGRSPSIPSTRRAGAARHAARARREAPRSVCGRCA